MPKIPRKGAVRVPFAVSTPPSYAPCLAGLPDVDWQSIVSQTPRQSNHVHPSSGLGAVGSRPVDSGSSAMRSCGLFSLPDLFGERREDYGVCPSHAQQRESTDGSVGVDHVLVWWYCFSRQSNAPLTLFV